jgi:N-sulfoglucosamine sulfohydrolase
MSQSGQEVLTHPERLMGRRSLAAFQHRPVFELYDLQNDPDEVANLVDSPEHTELLGALKADLRAFQERTADPWAHKWEYE